MITSIQGALILEANGFTLKDAYIALKNEACETCGEPGFFIYMITCERVCFMCLYSRFRCEPLEMVGSAHDSHKMPRPDLRLAPSVVVRRGWRYGMPLFCGHSHAEDPRRECRWERNESCTRFWDAKDLSWHQQRLIVSEKYNRGRAARIFASFLVCVRVPLAKDWRHEDDHETGLCMGSLNGSEKTTWREDWASKRESLCREGQILIDGLLSAATTDESVRAQLQPVLWRAILGQIKPQH